ncbi:geranylgeranylglycerol-phosphate geranylgeranyltransferase [Marinirhabdus gelatinilytica]|uniref:4-hydroxybenzoate polyprenyltransferase n=1 Tax=Marinirhabdus gelatinilytica TaxID=1703343 RepID=A0A370QB10_9FLAO|nr:geranylgeranylglycerol-phosphate geranylgeranyltransferase [Marinirhabdus gelatinilytica]RDK85565.1 4-hydroxybenzoate polyprenyltransferase [Marinirhabdus gelatinilytica]
MAYLKIIRPNNLLLLLLVQSILKYGFLEPLGIPLAMSGFGFGLLVVATLCIAAAGNVINDIQDVGIDTINKPDNVLVGRKISEKTAYTFYIVLNILGVVAGFVLANRLGHPGLAAVFIIISALLYSYALYLKTILLVGNLTVSFLVAMGLIVLIIFDMYPAITTELMDSQNMAAKTILWYAGSAFYLNLVREIVKDVQDINGDKKGGRNTLPILLGRNRVRNILFVLGVFMLLAILWFAYDFLYQFTWVAAYFVFLIAAPVLYFCIKVFHAESATDYKMLSTVLKLTMFTGVCSLPFFAEILNF